MIIRRFSFTPPPVDPVQAPARIRQKVITDTHLELFAGWSYTNPHVERVEDMCNKAKPADSEKPFPQNRSDKVAMVAANRKVIMYILASSFFCNVFHLRNSILYSRAMFSPAKNIAMPKTDSVCEL